MWYSSSEFVTDSLSESYEDTALLKAEEMEEIKISEMELSLSELLPSEAESEVLRSSRSSATHC